MENYQLRKWYSPLIIRTHGIRKKLVLTFVILFFKFRQDVEVCLALFIQLVLLQWTKSNFFVHFARDAPFNIDIFETLPALIAQKTVCLIKS